MKKPSVKTLRNKADALWGKAVRQRDGACRRCGKTEVLQAAHIISRRYKATRWDLDNGIALCRGCHHWNHHFPVEYDWWIRELIGEKKYESLRLQALDYVGEVKRVDLETIVAYLMSELEEMDAA